MCKCSCPANDEALQTHRQGLLQAAQRYFLAIRGDGQPDRVYSDGWFPQPVSPPLPWSHLVSVYITVATAEGVKRTLSCPGHF